MARIIWEIVWFLFWNLCRTTVLSTQLLENVAICGQNFKKLDSIPPGIQQSDEAEGLSSVGKKAELWILANQSLPRQPVRCSLELTACAVCQIRISWDISNLGALNQDKGDRDRGSTWDPGTSECPISSGLREEPCIEIVFEEDEAGALSRNARPYVRYNLLHKLPKSNFTSTAFKLKIKLKIYWPTHQQERFLKRLFPIKIDVIDNTVIRKGQPATADLSSIKYSSGYIESPRYPNSYPDSVQINYTLINEAGGPVRLIFSDFQLHYMSLLKIIDSNGMEILNTQGQFGASEGRPAAVQSTGARLELLFAGNHYTQLVGFRARYEFAEDEYWPEAPDSKSCDKLYEKSGGSITIPSNSLSINEYVDCVWIIGKSRYGSRLYDKLYVKVEDFDIETNSKGIHLEIRNGKASVDRLVMDIWGPKSTEELAGLQPQEGFIADLRDNDEHPKGFYIRIRGYLASYSGLTISFAQYYRWATAMCHDSNEFHCDNGRCIKNELRCDQKDHCGDFSDEKGERCVKTGSTNSNGNRVPGPTAKDKRFPLGSYTTTILLVAGLIGLTLVMLMVTVIVARIYRQRLIRRFTREANAAAATRSQSSPRSDVADVGARASGPQMQRVGDRRYYVMPDTDVQMFEAPPAYDDALKHPSVPPSRRLSAPSEAEIISSPPCYVNPDSAFDNPGFSGDSEPGTSLPHPSSYGGPPPTMPVIQESGHTPAAVQQHSGHTFPSDATCSVTSDSETDDPHCDGTGSSDTEDCASSVADSYVANRPERTVSNSSKTGPLSGILQWAKGKVTGSKNHESQDPETTREDNQSVKSGDEDQDCSLDVVVGNDDAEEKIVAEPVGTGMVTVEIVAETHQPTESDPAQEEHNDDGVENSESAL